MNFTLRFTGRSRISPLSFGYVTISRFCYYFRYYFELKWLSSRVRGC
jgi:hypothetical protein